MTSKLTMIFAIGMALLCAACTTQIYGTVRLVDQNDKEIEGLAPQGTVVNMINTTAKVESASTSCVVDEKGKFQSAKDSITEGTYKVEASRIGFATETQTVEVKGSEKLEFTLKKIEESQRKTISGASSDADKIVNPGEVNIQPPGM